MNKNFDQVRAMCLINSENFEKAFDYITPFAHNGDPSAQLLVAQRFMFGWGVNQSRKTAVRWLEKVIANPKASDEDRARSYYSNAQDYKIGNGVEKDTDKAFAYMKNAADLNYPNAVFNVFVYYYQGEIVARDYEKAFEYCRKAAVLNVPNAFVPLGNLYLEGYGVEKNYSKALKWYKKAADLDNGEAFCCLGYMYLYGLEVKKDYPKAFECMKKSADKNIPEALLNLGVFYKEGTGTDKSIEKSFECYQRCADLGMPSAMHNVATYYLNGKGVEKNLDKAIEYFKKAQQNGVEESLIPLGSLYLERKEYDKAKEIFEKAVKNQDTEINSRAKYFLGIIYFNGSGVERDIQKAIGLFEDAGERGFSFAYTTIASIYWCDGIPEIKKDLDKAASYFLKDKNNFAEQNMYLLMKQECNRAWEWAEDEIKKGNASVSAYTALLYLLGIGTEMNREKAMEIVSSDNCKDDVLSLLIMSHCSEMGYGEKGVNVAESARLQTSAIEIDGEIANEKQKIIVREIEYKQKSEEERITELKTQRDELQKKLDEKEKDNLNSDTIISMLAKMETALSKNTRVLERSEEAFGRVESKVDSIRYDIQALISNVEDFKKGNDALFETIENLKIQIGSSSKDVDKKISDLLEAETELSERLNAFCVKNKATDVAACDKIADSLKNIFGENWYKLDGYTQNALITGEYTFDYLNNSKLNNLDFSGVCIYVCSALEHQLKQVLFVGLQNYLENSDEEIAGWPRNLIHTDRQSGEVSRNDGRWLTLGFIPFYLGLKESDKIDKKLNGVLEKYLKVITGNPDFTVEDNMKNIVDRIEKVTVKYRNPAAHTARVDRELANDCLEKIVGRNEASQRIETVKGLLLELTVMFANYKIPTT